MNPILISYGALAVAIICEVTGSTFLQKSEQFTRLVPTATMALAYVASFYFLSIALKAMPLGIAYAVWGGLGIVLTAIVNVVVFRHPLDAWAYVGIALIVSGVMVMNLLSNSSGH